MASVRDFMLKERAFYDQIMKHQQKVSYLDGADETVEQRKIRISSEIYTLCAGEVQHGPFKGLRFKNNSWWDCDLSPMLLGIYESHIVETIFSKELSHLTQFVDIGAGDGFYVCGLSHTGRFKHCTGFEASEKGRQVIQDNAALNNVEDKVTILGAANEHFIHQLDVNSLADTLFLIDIEGGEFDILTPENLQKIKQATMIVEIHNYDDDFIDKYEALLTQASLYFDITLIEPKYEFSHLFEQFRHLKDDDRFLMCSESRNNMMRYIKFTPKTTQPV